MARKIPQFESGQSVPKSELTHEAAFGYPRDFLDNQFVYLAISSRARGLSIGVNVNPLVKCSLQCLYCEIDRSKAPRAARFDATRMAEELQGTFGMARSGALRRLTRYAKFPDELLQVRHVAISGDGEPTLSSHFVEAVETIVRLRERSVLPSFKMVVVTNSTALDQPTVQYGLKLLAPTDEIWAKLDGGTQDYIKRVNGAPISLPKILDNILLIARQRPVIIQSLFPAINGAPPPDEEINAYAQRLKELKSAGANIPLVQVYSAMRPMVQNGCGHLPLKTLSQIAKTVRQVADLRAEVF